MARTERDARFGEFVLTHSAALLRTAFLLTGDRGHAEDLVQTALLKTYRHWDRLRNQEEPTAFVRRVMVTTHNSWRRRRASTEQVMADVPERPGPDREPYDESRDEMRLALATLPARMRAVVVLRYYEDLSEAETARLLGCTVGTVKSQSFRGLARLRSELAHPCLPTRARGGQR